nr:MAG TPA: hypothetical protein [Caudoviricetes sp.]DAK24401.1 MAG TPA: hypothetical protein [Caudoviricetes sp.]DAP47297.1 MAG TPA: hypothetical protein [Caudoviricetes sp.]DAW43133.1 MAG TPA: hypothetical protein [Caudoviricetes sp.]
MPWMRIFSSKGWSQGSAPGGNSAVYCHAL